MTGNDTPLSLCDGNKARAWDGRAGGAASSLHLGKRSRGCTAPGAHQLGRLYRLKPLGGSVGAEKLCSHMAKQTPQTWLKAGSDTSQSAITFIKHCEEQHKLFLLALIPITGQGSCKMQ